MGENKKLIAIIGSTGAQGGGLVEAILEECERQQDCEFTVRALARYEIGEKALSLKKRDVEVVHADVNDEMALTKAIQGAYGLFCVSFYWEAMNPDEERHQAKNMAFAAREAGVKHVIWSTLEDTRVDIGDTKMPTLMGCYKAPHFEAKSESDRYFIEAQVPTTYLVTSFYWDNFVNNRDLKQPKLMPGGRWQLVLPMGEKRLPGIAAEDIGKCALGIFHNPEIYINQRIGIIGEALTGCEIASKMSAILGREIFYDKNKPDFDAYRSQMFRGAAEYGNMFQYFHDFEEKAVNERSIERSRALCGKLMTFEQWLEKNKHRF